MQITILGLGPGDPGHLTRAAWQRIAAADTLYLRTTIHPTIAALPGHLTIHSFDHLYDQADTFEAIYEQIAGVLIERAGAGADVLYAVPGDPMVAEATTRHVRSVARTRGVGVAIISGVSFIEPVCAALELDPLEHGLQLLDALDLVPVLGNAAPPTSAGQPASASWASLHGYQYDPPLMPFPLVATRPALICQVYSRRIAAHVKLSLLERFPADHRVTLVRAAGVTGQEHVWSVPLHELDHHDEVDHLTCVFVPPLAVLADTRSSDGISYVVARLLGPAGCPWDREQTPQSLRAGLLGETYEVLEALDNDDPDALSEELGDLLLNILAQAEMARQAGPFSIQDVYEHVTTKLIRRHPHVFGDLAVGGSGDVLRNWDAIKQAERASQGRTPRGTLDGIPRELPALAQAQELAGKAAKTGFEWRQAEDIWAKIFEEIGEVQAVAGAHDLNSTERQAQLARELGDLLLATAVLARHLGVDAESALRSASSRFRDRFERIEQLASDERRTLRDLTLDEMLALWARAKQVVGG